jgi:hypothetical protein
MPAPVEPTPAEMDVITHLNAANEAFAKLCQSPEGGGFSDLEAFTTGMRIAQGAIATRIVRRTGTNIQPR